MYDTIIITRFVQRVGSHCIMVTTRCIIIIYMYIHVEAQVQKHRDTKYTRLENASGV